MTAVKSTLEDIFRAALAASDPYRAVEKYVGTIRREYRDGGFRRLVVVGLGKAAFSMSRALHDCLGLRIDGGIVVTKYGHADPAVPLGAIEVYEGGHPLPDENGFRATRKVIDLRGTFDERTLAVCLVSGGGSAIFVAPAGGILLAEKQKLTNLLLRCGAPIEELNTVRKHISRVKGGRLAEILYPARVISLVLSDVVGDPLDIIASGVTSPDGSTYADAMAILEKHRLLPEVPPSILDHLDRGVRGLVPETPKPGDRVFARVDNRIIGSNRLALDAARSRAAALGFQAEIIARDVVGEAADYGRKLAAVAREAKARAGREGRKLCLISGGEPTVTVRGNGVGGRNTELALAFAIAAEGVEDVGLLAAGTDGTDGPTDAAGAVADGSTVGRGRAMGLTADASLANNDSYTFFKSLGDLVITGPTGTNVIDVHLLAVQ
ncbi:MAG: putative hydroxypyruvate reductase [Syntrophaceae bacterium PtaU1.Bin231]|nr:MAG: putative hydroxypyruvate reductase [Syntrophaceae bacterium PtaU1.Bin231]